MQTLKSNNSTNHDYIRSPSFADETQFIFKQTKDEKAKDQSQTLQSLNQQLRIITENSEQQKQQETNNNNQFDKNKEMKKYMIESTQPKYNPRFSQILPKQNQNADKFTRESASFIKIIQNMLLNQEQKDKYKKVDNNIQQTSIRKSILPRNQQSYCESCQPSSVISFRRKSSLNQKFKITFNKQIICQRIIQIIDDSLILDNQGELLIFEITKLKLIVDIDKFQNINGDIKITKQQQPLIFKCLQQQKQHTPKQYKLFSALLTLKLEQVKNLQEYEWKKVPHAIPNVHLNSFIFGYIYKKSQYLGQWGKRYAIVKQEGIYCYHSHTDESHTFFIKAENITQIWTRFQLFHDYLIVKIKHGLRKTQFGIPVCNFTQKSFNNWLYQFYKIALRSKLI